MNLAEKKCKPCEGGIPKLSQEQAKKLLEQVPNWNIAGDKLEKTFKFKNFVEAMEFLNRVAEIAENENHHPDFCVHYNRVEMSLWTHAINGLSENDFILAAKIEEQTQK